MPAIAVPQDKYFLRSLHQEIGLFDRKLAHLLKYESFPSDAERNTAANKLINKRDQLAVTARRLAADGVEFKLSELPPSLRPDDFTMPPAPDDESPEVAEVPRQTSPVPGYKAFDLGKEVRAYLDQRKKKENLRPGASE